ncbi:hypothetical protein BGZ98_006409 [Dissophora globulifera]|nr:hypothetical protein BGZ98_006409 [Dissophora globulifera]
MIVPEASDSDELDELSREEFESQMRQAGRAVASTTTTGSKSPVDAVFRRVASFPPLRTFSSTSEAHYSSKSISKAMSNVDLSRPTSVSRRQATSSKKSILQAEGYNEEDGRTSKNTPRPSVSYTVTDNYLAETANVVIIGEDDSLQDMTGNEDTLPVRMLDDFAIYNMCDRVGKNCYRMTSLSNCHEEGFELRASGKVSPIFAKEDEEDIDQGLDADDDDDNNEDGNDLEDTDQFINLSSLFYFEFGRDEKTQEDVIWIRTEFAFYRLGRPLLKYASFHEELLAMDRDPGNHSGEDIDGTYDYFEEAEDEDEDDNDWRDDGMMAAGPSATSTSAGGVGPLTKSRKSNKPKTAVASKNSRQPNTKSSTAAAEPCVTPLIASLAGDLFNRQLNIASHIGDVAATALIDNENQLSSIENYYTHQVDWVGPRIGCSDASDEEEDGSKVYYSSACVDGVTLRQGDCVYVRNDGEHPWLAKIMYFFERENGSKCFHIRFFSRGAETVLMETAGVRELFLLDDCANNELCTVMGLNSVAFVGPNDDIPASGYYYRQVYRYDPQVCAFEDASLHEDALQKALVKEIPQVQRRFRMEPCYSCIRMLKEIQKASPPRCLDDDNGGLSLQFDGQVYHKHDFVYLADSQIVRGVMTPKKLSEAQITPFSIGQIIEIAAPPSTTATKTPVLTIRMLERYDSLMKSPPNITSRKNRIYKPHFSDCRRLVLTDVSCRYSADALNGTCHVKFISTQEESDMDTRRALGRYKDLADRYYYKDYVVPELAQVRGGAHSGAMRERLVRIAGGDGQDGEGEAEFRGTIVPIKHAIPCLICAKQRQEEEVAKQEFITHIQGDGDGRNKKLRALDIFSGCGGLSAGLRESGVVETRYAIEFMTSAAKTFRHNFPNATVYNDDANVLLSRAIEKHGGKPVAPRKDFAKKPLPDMPAPATSLSYVDFYKPKYFLLENVQGMLRFKLGMSAVKGQLTGGIQQGVVKFIVRSLTAMGYQCRFSVLQAGHHGLPQSRRRFFIWGARLGTALPTLPIPSTCFTEKHALKISPPASLAGHTSFTYQGRRTRQAPDPAVTVREAIADLPGFEYINPRALCEESEEEKEERLREERWAFREFARIQRRKRKHAQRLAEKYGVEIETTDVDGYPSSCDEEEEEMEHQEELEARDLERESERRVRQGGQATVFPGRPYFPQIDGSSGLEGVGFTGQPGEDNVGKYWTRPQSEYQRRMRSRIDGQEQQHVLNHVVRPFNHVNLERICRVEMVPDADHQSLPEPLKPWCLSSPDSRARFHNGWKGLYGRLNLDGHFQTAVTEMQPMGKRGKVIHPNQCRVLSVRETARIQGFPDEFEFLSATNTVKCLYKQVGNAVPPPLARALGLKLREAMMADLHKLRQEVDGDDKNEEEEREDMDLEAEQERRRRENKK